MNKNLRTFEQHDWDAFAGASQLPDGREPMIGIVSAGTGWCVIVSGGGIGACGQDTAVVQICTDDGAVYQNECEDTAHAVVLATIVLEMGMLPMIMSCFAKIADGDGSEPDGRYVNQDGRHGR